MRIQAWRSTELLQTLDVTTVCSHTSQPRWNLPSPCWYVLVVALSTWFAKRLSTHQSSRASAGVYGTFPAWRSRRDSPVDSNLESLRPPILLSEPRTVLHDARTLKNWGCVGWNSIILWFQIYFNTRNTFCGTRRQVRNAQTVSIIMAGCIAHARKGRISTSGLKYDITIVFLDPDFL